MAMALTLAEPGNLPVPDFMILNAAPDAVRDLCCVLPGSWVWLPFKSIWFGVFWGLALPTAIAFCAGYAMFRRRTSGVYVAIITLALAITAQLIIINNQPITGGVNGLPNLAYLNLFGHQFDPYATDTYYLVAIILSVVLVGLRWLMSSRAGLVLRAIQDDVSRVRFLGYKEYRYQVFFFTLSTVIASISGMLFVIVAGFASPSFLEVTFSVSMVIWAAVGGRGSLLGACLGGIAVNMVGSVASESAAFQPIWPIIIGLLFIVSVLFFPSGVAGYLDRAVRRWLNKRNKTPVIPTDPAQGSDLASESSLGEPTDSAKCKKKGERWSVRVVAGPDMSKPNKDLGA